MEAQRRYQDSIAKIEYAQQLELQKQENKSALVEDSLENLPDSVRAQRLQQSFGVFGDAMVGTEDYTTLQNDVVELRISNKGGRICYARLKEYDTYNDEPLVLSLIHIFSYRQTVYSRGDVYLRFEMSLAYY